MPPPQARQAAGRGRAEPRRSWRRAQINLRFTRVPAPITGRIGRSLVTDGALVTANQADPLARDPAARSDLRRHPAVERRPARAAPRARAAAASRRPAPSVRLKLEDGSDYRPDRHGRVLRSDGRSEHRHRDAARALPQSARAAAARHVRPRALRAGDRRAAPSWCRRPALSRDPKGDGDGLCRRAGQQGGAAHGRSPTARVGANWVVTQGLQAGRQGDRRRACASCSPDADDQPVPAGTPQRIDAAGRRGRQPPAPPAAQGRLTRMHVAHLHRSADLRLGASRSSSCWRASARSCRCRSSNIPTSRRRRSTIRASYPGASAETRAEQRHPGDRAAADRHRRAALFQLVTRPRAARSTITVTFEKGTDPDIAQVQVQNKVQQALSAPAAAGAAAGPARHQVQPRLPDDRRRL